jgi:hypothetical protein
MATAVSLLNHVKTGLRRGSFTASSTTDLYDLMLIQMLNQAKELVEDSWDWYALRSTITLTLGSGTAAYTLSGGGGANGSAAVSDRGRILYERGVNAGGPLAITHTQLPPQPQVFNTTTAPNYRLVEIPTEQMEGLHLSDNNETGEPMYFSLYTNAANRLVKFWPTPDATYTISMRFVIPQAVIPSSSMNSYTLSVPDMPIQTLALAYAVEERGDGQGYNLQALHDRANETLYDMIAREMTDEDRTGHPV